MTPLIALSDDEDEDTTPASSGEFGGAEVEWNEYVDHPHRLPESLSLVEFWGVSFFFIRHADAPLIIEHRLTHSISRPGHQLLGTTFQ